MANNKQQRHSLQKRNRRSTRVNATKGGARKATRMGTKHDRAMRTFRSQHAMGGLKAIGANPEYYPPRGKFKGWMRDHTGKKVA